MIVIRPPGYLYSTIYSNREGPDIFLLLLLSARGGPEGRLALMSINTHQAWGEGGLNIKAIRRLRIYKDICRGLYNLRYITLTPLGVGAIYNTKYILCKFIKYRLSPRQWGGPEGWEDILVWYRYIENSRFFLYICLIACSRSRWQLWHIGLLL